MRKQIYLTFSKALQSTSSLTFSKGSKLYLTVAENNTGSWGIMEIFDRKSLSRTLAVSTSSMAITPSIGARRNRAAIRVDLPAPVLPTIPT